MIMIKIKMKENDNHLDRNKRAVVQMNANFAFHFSAGSGRNRDDSGAISASVLKQNGFLRGGSVGEEGSVMRVVALCEESGVRANAIDVVGIGRERAKKHILRPEQIAHAA